MYKQLILIISILLTTSFLTGCSTGDLRAWNDAMAGANGYSVTYPDQSDTVYIDDIKWTTGIRDGSGFQYIKNTSSDYCRVRIRYEDDSYDYFNLGPNESTSRMYVSIYNWTDYLNYICNTTSSVFRESF